MSNKKVSTSDALTNFERLWDCLVAIERIQDDHPDSYNDVIYCLLNKAKDIVEEGVRDIKTVRERR